MTSTRRVDVADLAAGLVLVAVGVGILLLSMDFRPASSPGRDPSILPRAVAVVLTASGLGIAAAGLLGRPRRDTPSPAGIPESAAVPEPAAVPGGTPVGAPAPVTGDAAEAPAGEPTVGTVVEEPPAAGPVVATVAGVVVYAWLAMSVGYLVSTLAFLVALPLALTTRRDRRTLVITLLFAAGLTLVTHLVFIEFLHVPIPPTPLP